MKQIVLIKLGGSSLGNPETLQELVELVKGFQKKRSHVVVVHGGGPAINQELARRGISWKFIDGQRQTTPEMMGVINQVLAQDINSMLVNTFKAHGIRAVGLSGAKNNMLSCSQAKPELLQVGQVDEVQTQSIMAQLQSFNCPVPVIAPIGIGKSGELYNVNADWAATKIAIALQAHKLIFLTDQRGILDQDKELITQADPSLLERLIAEGTISGGMCTKVRAMMVALRSGLKQVRVLHASQASQLLNEVKIGTLLTECKIPKAKEIINVRVI